MSTNDKLDSRARLPRDERRAILLTAALEVFTVSGYHAASMDEIADRANVSKPVLYQHFPSKLDLYLAVLDLHIDSLVFALQKAIASTKENKNRVKATVDAYFGFIDDEGGAFRLLFESDMSVEPQVRERLNRMTYDCAVAVSAVISIDERDLAVVCAMHDLNLAARYFDRVAMMRSGRLVALGNPSEVLTPSNVRDVFDAEVQVLRDSATGAMHVLPRSGGAWRPRDPGTEGS